MSISNLFVELDRMIHILRAEYSIPSNAADVAAAASEAAGFAAWPHADMYDIGSARAYYRIAIGRAR